jgi:hypothetical protein
VSLASEPELTIGFKDRNWRGPKVACGKCGKRVRGGLTHYKDVSDPPAHVLCRTCFAAPARPGFYGEDASEVTSVSKPVNL